MDPGNPVIRCCTEGMQAEADGRVEDAMRHFEQAWENRQNDYDSCMAAHYVARHRSESEALHWNRIALEHALKCPPETVAAFLPSLHGSIAQSLEKSGQAEEALTHHEAGAKLLHLLPEGPYRVMVGGAIESGLARLCDVT